MASKLKIGQTLKIIMKKEKMSITELATKVGVPKSTLFGYLQNTMPSRVEHIYKICQELKITSDYLLFGDVKDKNKREKKIKKDTTIKGVFKIIEIDKIIN